MFDDRSTHQANDFFGFVKYKLYMSGSKRIEGFAPIIDTRAGVLILGSMPSVASLEKQQYYGKPQNAFWRIMGELFDCGPELSYRERCAGLADAGVGVWDVLASCVRPGSLDSAIDMRSAEVNDFVVFLREYPSIQHIFFNGRKAEDIFQRRIIAEIGAPGAVSFTCLPSTSPAMATLNFAAKLERWRVVAKVIGASG